MSIRLENVTRRFGMQTAVDALSFEVAKGEIVGFLGPNGAGKSTTMRMITGFLRPDAGTIRVCGIDVARRPREARARIGYLPEANPLYPDMYIREYLSFIAGLHGIQRPAGRIEEVMRTTGLTPEAHKLVGQLSKGYRQRVGLAAALIHDPEVLVLDEPTSGLDPNQIIEIRDVVRRLGAEKTILFSSHVLQEVEALCQRVVIISRGRAVADDRIEGLRRNAAGQTVKASFREPVREEELTGLPGVLSAHKDAQGDWLLRTSDADSLRKALLALALQRDLNIVSLHTETSSLEDVFRELTTGPLPAAQESGQY